MPFSTERTDLIRSLLRRRLAAGVKDDWQRSFFTNMEAQFAQSGERTRLSPSQYRKLHQLLEIPRETATPVMSASRAGADARAAHRPDRAVSQSPPRQTPQPPRQIQGHPRPPSSEPRSLDTPKQVPERAGPQLALAALLLVFVVASLGALLPLGASQEPSREGHSDQQVQQQVGGVLYVDGNSVNQRAGPGTSHGVLGSLPRGSQVREVTAQGDWTQISSPLGTGWMSSRFLTPQKPGTIQQQTTRQPATPDVTARGRVIRARDVRVIDGDTVSVSGERANVRLVGFNAPEVTRPSCQAESAMGQRATSRLRDLLTQAGKIEFEAVACACPPGTQGTNRCNFGRQCGSLYSDGIDVGRILIGEGLAVSYICGRTSCPRRPGNWCGG